MINKLRHLRAILRSILFNFRNLPFHQACKLPILIYKGNIKNTGVIRIVSKVTHGMIRLGVNTVSLFPNNGINIENRGEIVFHGTAYIGNNSAISVNQTGKLEFGQQFGASTGLKIACYSHISIENRVRMGWNVTILDTSFHALTNSQTSAVNRKGHAPIKIGHDVWIANGCKIYKGVSIPPFCVVGGDTILHKAIDCPPYTLITNKQETRINTTGLYRNIDDDKLDYYID